MSVGWVTVSGAGLGGTWMAGAERMREQALGYLCMKEKGLHDLVETVDKYS